MKKSSKVFFSILSVVVAAVLFSLPISLLTEKTANASNSQAIFENAKNSIQSSEDGYFFAIIEDDDVALAATPFENVANVTVVHVVGLSLVLMLLIAYASWYTMVRRNIYNYSNVLPDSEIRALIPAKAFLHPSKLSEAEIEVQYRAAKKYV